MTFTSILKDFTGGGLASALPSAATLGPTIPTGYSAFYFATDTNVLYRLASGDTAWQTASGSGSGITVSDGTHTETGVTDVVFSGATVSSGGSGIADVSISGGGGGGGLVSTVSLVQVGICVRTGDPADGSTLALSSAATPGNTILIVVAGGGFNDPVGFTNAGYFNAGNQHFAVWTRLAQSGDISFTVNGGDHNNWAIYELANLKGLIVQAGLYSTNNDVSPYSHFLSAACVENGMTFFGLENDGTTGYVPDTIAGVTYDLIGVPVGPGTNHSGLLGHTDINVGGLYLTGTGGTSATIFGTAIAY